MRSVCGFGGRRATCLIFFLGLIALCPGERVGRAVAAETVFLQDGRTIQADKVEIIGDTVRIEKPAETIYIPRSEVLTIHPAPSPQVPPGPANVYRDTTRQMNDKIRGEIESRPGGVGVR